MSRLGSIVFRLQSVRAASPAFLHQADLSSESCSKEKIKAKENLSEVSLVNFGWRHRVPKKGWRMQMFLKCSSSFVGGRIPAGGSTLLMIGGQGFNSLWRHKHTTTFECLSSPFRDRDTKLTFICCVAGTFMEEVNQFVRLRLVTV